MPETNQHPLRGPWDIVIVGGGNAALCAAITAAETGARVLILESAPKVYRGGNSRHTRNFRCMHHGPLSVLTGTYEEAEYYDDLLLVTNGKTDEHLARLAIRATEECLPWMQSHGVRFQLQCELDYALARTDPVLVLRKSRFRMRHQNVWRPCGSEKGGGCDR